MENLIKYVNPNIGTIGHLLQSTASSVYYPHGMMQISPNFKPGLVDRYNSDRIYSFPVGPITVMAIRDNQILNSNEKFNPIDISSVFDHDLEEISPSRYSVFLETPNIQTTFSTDRHSAIFNFDFNVEKGDIIIICDKENVNIDNNTAEMTGKYFGIKSYGFTMFSKKPEKIEIINEITERDGTIKSVYKFSFNSGLISMKTGISFIDFQQAKDNLIKEIDDFDIEKVVLKSENEWNKQLNKIIVEGDEDKKSIFYTAVYRASLRPYNLSEYGRYYSNYDGKIHNDDGHEFYCGDGLWDTFRCLHPLHILTDEKLHEDVLASYVRMYEQSGLMPNFPYPMRDNAYMLGFHSAALFADAYCKGVKFDLKKAYDGVRKNAFERTMLPWKSVESTVLDKCYYENGFFPARPTEKTEWIEEVHRFEGRQSVAVTLEHSYSDWCAMILAQALGENDDATILEKRSKNYKNVFNPETKFMSPKTDDGEFVSDFNPKLSGGQGGRMYFAENNSWTYSYSVFHDIDGLIELYGGKDEFIKRLDQLFVESYEVSKYDFLKQFPDSTGLIGQFTMGNEPAFHIPYLYSYVGQEAKTQRKIHEIAYLWFHNHPLGICGDEDGGAMSAWYIFSAMGFYPVCPGKAEYAMGSPLFDKITINGDNAKLVINAKGASGKEKYIKSMKLNGKILDKPFLMHEDFYKNAELDLEMVKQL